MHQISVESGLGQKLGQLAEQAILCDSNGRALGFFSGTPLEEILSRVGVKWPAECCGRRKPTHAARCGLDGLPLMSGSCRNAVAAEV